MKKVLYTASTDIHLVNFHVPYIKLLRDWGYEVHVACNGKDKIPFADKQYQVAFQRFPLEKKNLESYNILKELIDKNNYELIHCHTPTCGVITRLAAREARKRGTRVIYTAHGFHFYKGASLKNWLLFYPIEVLLSYITDGIITMNVEDFNRLKTSAFKSKFKYIIEGIGVNPKRLEFKEKELDNLRNELSLASDDIVVLYIAEFTPRKNHEFIFNNLKKILIENPNIKFLFAGGFSSEKNKLEQVAIRDGFIEKIRFLGYRNDIGKIIALADLGVSPSIAEGLPIGILELMYNNIPVIASSIRGHNDIINDGENGYLFGFNESEKFIKNVVKLSKEKRLRLEMGFTAKKSTEKFLLPKAITNMTKIYEVFLD